MKRRIFVSIVVLISALSFAPAFAVAADADDTLFRFETTFQSAGTYHGSIFGLSSDVNVGSRTKLLPRAENLTRTFDEGPTFNETTLTMDVAQKLSSHWYVIGGASMTPNAVLNPKWATRVDPHYAFGNHDFGLRLAYAEYTAESAGIFTPEYYYSVSDVWAFGESIPCARADQWYCSSATQLIYKPIRRATLRFVPAFGRTLESAGAPASFSSLALEAAYDIGRRLRLGLGGAAYSSTLRHENSILLRLEAW